ncbi:META domain-containing protein [Chryseobacterium formosus]|uniref:META domain-containing protein n=1 Tax=Chryseobacterium formosus TaxID=1537363 RepID=A0ABT3XK75_9FLAO|nr:META domain-containing protein [Chryseobacterium formosus]MCX8522547.1 META domain-containing protein [Chryseobacterium formosus]
MENQHIQRQWMLVSFDQFSKDQLVKNKAEINLTAEKKDGKIRGTAFMGCNRMFFNSEFKSKNRVEISGVGSTLMACQEMDLETKFAQSFEKMTRYQIEGHFLTLSDEKGNQMKFIAADWD